MAAIMNPSMSDWASAILDSDTLLSSLRFTQKHSHSILTLTQTNSIWLKLIHSHLTWWWQSYCILPFFTKINFTHSFWLNLMMAAILNSAILDSAIFLKTLTPTNSIWLKVIHPDSTWWWQPYCILHLEFFHKNKLHSSHFDSTLMMAAILDTCYYFGFSHYLHKKKTFTHSFWLNLMMAAILNSAMFRLSLCQLGFSHFSYLPLKLTHNCQDSGFHSDFALKLIQFDSNSFIISQHDDDSHLEFCHVGFSHLRFSHFLSNPLYTCQD